MLMLMERDARIELANNPWQGFRLPLHQSRSVLFIKTKGAPAPFFELRPLRSRNARTLQSLT